ncbi:MULTISPECIES: L,D-transpeptidase family protein [Bosea]|uniref:Murein L,D-transpeptidase YcbB/YkuD n=1 Tax=Bosea robiniae TaxID=1036780 RepID=A0ABY0P4P8_9HYPH|nr:MULTISPECIES: L,D-transpeptidase family protein [Bosea]TQI74164.1 murein L,D-transpeptidase YcbB/YkuD [Bosea sp. AK1]SDH23131.1 Murein L,D-transpeptidase YcbB/YkuD [Bosea robiniae]
MRPRHWAKLTSASALAIILGCLPLRAETPAATDATLGIPLPEQPELRLSDVAPSTAPAQAATAPSADAEIVTGTVTTGNRPLDPARQDAAAPLDSEEPLTLDIPAVEMPAADPALTPVVKSPEPVETAPQPGPLRTVEPLVPLPEMPKVVVEVPPGSEFAAAVAAALPDALTLRRLGERERNEIVAAYQANENRPFWVGSKGWNEAGKLIATQLGRAAEDGLRPNDYPLPVFEASDKARLAEADIRLSALAVLYARDARGGRLNPRQLSKLITPTLYLPSATEVLSELAGAADADAVLAAYNPPHEQYRRLKAKLAEMREHLDDTPLVRIPAGPPLKLGMRDERVALVRARLGLGPSEEPVFDRSTALALADFQKKAGLPANGILSERTLAALGKPASARGEEDIIAQMERWRWLPPDLGTDHIIANVPEMRVRVIRSGKVVHETRAIIGKPDSATPIFSHKMDHVIVNPSWYVPPSILKKEFLPGLAADPNYAAKRGYIVTRTKSGGISVRQPPGERNALGWIKFMFPNEHAVYLHDTPNRRLFAGERRALSHGCVRVENPFALADQVLGPEWTHERLKRLIGKGERRINLPQPLPIHLVYNTIVVGDHGQIHRFDDVYGFHRLVRQALEHQGG